MEFLKNNPKWIRQPKQVQISEDKVVILTERGTDLWARTYYGFQNDNAPVLQTKTKEKFFSFVVKTEFESKHRFDQCGVAIYLNSENWLKASIEYEKPGTIELAERASEGIKNEDVLILKNHGVICVNENLQEAKLLAVFVEETAKTQFVTYMLDSVED